MAQKVNRIGYLPRKKILEIIDELASEELLSRSKVVGLLVEEALLARGMIGNNINSNFNMPIKEVSYTIKDEEEFVDDSGYMSNAIDRNKFGLSDEEIKISKIIKHLKTIGEI
tara:strand:- start:1160 stop:1498 length:339 start_codon:yes stop_codon:yes gene_type:complete